MIILKITFVMTELYQYSVHFLEDHCDVIPFFRACWRKKMFPSKDLLFIHFDAHPDLAVPSTTAVEVCM